jgi:hypothetical protein
MQEILDGDVTVLRLSWDNNLEGISQYGGYDHMTACQKRVKFSFFTSQVLTIDWKDQVSLSHIFT